MHGMPRALMPVAPPRFDELNDDEPVQPMRMVDADRGLYEETHRDREVPDILLDEVPE